MKYYHSEIMKNEVVKTQFMCILFTGFGNCTTYFLEQLFQQNIKERNQIAVSVSNDHQSIVTFQNSESLSTRKEKLFHEASHVSSTKNAACWK